MGLAGGLACALIAHISFVFYLLKKNRKFDRKKKQSSEFLVLQLELRQNVISLPHQPL